MKSNPQGSNDPTPWCSTPKADPPQRLCVWYTMGQPPWILIFQGHPGSGEFWNQINTSSSLSRSSGGSQAVFVLLGRQAVSLRCAWSATVIWWMVCVKQHPHEYQDAGFTNRILSCSEDDQCYLLQLLVALMLWQIGVYNWLNKGLRHKPVIADFALASVRSCFTLNHFELTAEELGLGSGLLVLSWHVRLRICINFG